MNGERRELGCSDAWTTWRVFRSAERLPSRLFRPRPFYIPLSQDTLAEWRLLFTKVGAKSRGTMNWGTRRGDRISARRTRQVSPLRIFFIYFNARRDCTTHWTVIALRLSLRNVPLRGKSSAQFSPNCSQNPEGILVVFFNFFGNINISRRDI